MVKLRSLLHDPSPSRPLDAFSLPFRTSSASLGDEGSPTIGKYVDAQEVSSQSLRHTTKGLFVADEANSVSLFPWSLPVASLC